MRVSSMKAGSSDTELIFTIPNLQGVTNVGKTVTLIVSANGTASISLEVFPYVPTIPSGQVFVTLSQPPAVAQLLAGQSYVFVYTVKAIADLDEIYTVTPTVSGGWSVVTVDSLGQPLTPSEISLPAAGPPAGSTIDVRIRLQIPGGLSNGTAATMRLTVTSKRNPTLLYGSSGGEQLAVGAAPPGAHADVVVAYVPGSVTPPPGAPAPSDSGGIVTIAPFSASYRLTFSAQITPAGTYLVEVVDQGDANWIVRLSANQTSAQLTATANSNNPIHVFVRALSGAQPSNVVLRVSSMVSPPDSGQFSQPIKI